MLQRGRVKKKKGRKRERVQVERKGQTLGINNMMQKGRVEKKIEGQKKEGRKERDGLLIVKRNNN